MVCPPGQIGRRPESIRHEIRTSITENQHGGVLWTAEEVAAELDVSKPYAYKLIRQLNEELKAKGFLTIAGRVNRQYFNERFYGTERKDADASL